MIEKVRSLLSDAPTVVYECRRCGRTVDAETDSCPVCGNDSIADYRVE